MDQLKWINEVVNDLSERDAYHRLDDRGRDSASKRERQKRFNNPKPEREFGVFLAIVGSVGAVGSICLIFGAAISIAGLSGGRLQLGTGIVLLVVGAGAWRWLINFTVRNL